MDNYIGRLLDNRYEILEVIGTGGMAVVYKARDHRLKRLVAVKILKDEYSQDDEFRRRFNAESQAVAMLSHPNIVSVYDVNICDGVNYIVMELIDGITLKQYMERRGQLNWRETLHFSIQIAKALEHAHSRGIIHRDIKPHNIMILKDGSVKVADFGIARVTSAQNTLTREALGSVHYISPEQAKGGKVDCRSDLYSLGVVMYEMMTARTPFDGDTPVSVAIQHINGTAQPPRELNPDIPVGLEQITMHAMTADLQGRYASATDMLNDLEEFRKDPTTVFHFAAPAAPEQRARSTQPRAGQAQHAARSAQPAQRRSAGQAQPRHNLAEVYGEKEEEVDPGKKRSIALIAVLAVLAASLVGYLVFGVLLRKTETVKVPNFVGISYEEIYPAEYPQFNLEVKEWVNDDTLDFGYIISQTPEGDTELKVKKNEKTTIYLTISMGAKSDTMPTLANMSIEDARKLLDTMGLDLQVSQENVSSSEFAKGTVINTDPVAGVKLESGQKVVLYVSTGEDDAEETKTMPDLTKQTEEKAKKLLDTLELSLQISLENESSSEYEAGTVIRTDPVAGTKLEKNQKVTLYVSTGAEKMKVPNVLGSTLDDATSEIQKAKLQVGTIKNVDSDQEKGTVVKQSVTAGTEVDEGTKIDLEISNGPKETKKAKVPNVIGDSLDAATSAIQAVNLKVGSIQNVDSDKAKGTVVKQSVAVGTEVDEGTKIDLQISNGPKQEEPTNPTTYRQKVEVDLPTKEEIGSDTVHVTLYLDGVKIADDDDIPVSDGYITVDLEGSGTKTLDVYFNGDWHHSQQVTFGG